MAGHWLNMVPNLEQHKGKKFFYCCLECNSERPSTISAILRISKCKVTVFCLNLRQIAGIFLPPSAWKQNCHISPTSFHVTFQFPNMTIN